MADAVAMGSNKRNGNTNLSVAVFSSLISKGAGASAVCVHESLIRSNVQSRLYVRADQKFPPSLPDIFPLQNEFCARWDRIQPKSRRKGFTSFGINEPAISNSRLGRLVESADIINLHWFARFLSVENVAYLSRLEKPLVITIRDMQALSGGCHYFHGCEKWKSDCISCPQIPDDNHDLPAKILEFKKNYWNLQNITVVALSKDSSEIIAQSPLFQGCRVEIIPNSIDTAIFMPTDQSQAREELGLSKDKKYVFYLPSYGGSIKGHEEFKGALIRLREMHPELDCQLLLAGTPQAGESYPFDSDSLGMIDDADQLALAYSAADLTIVPSLEETFSKTAAESLACGTPIVGFSVGAIPELVKEGSTGYTAQVGNTQELAEGIFRVLTGPSLSENCRSLMERHLDIDSLGKRYIELFQDLLKSPRPAMQLHDMPEIAPEIAPALMARVSARLAEISLTRPNAFPTTLKDPVTFSENMKSDDPGASSKGPDNGGVATNDSHSFNKLSPENIRTRNISLSRLGQFVMWIRRHRPIEASIAVLIALIGPLILAFSSLGEAYGWQLFAFAAFASTALISIFLILFILSRFNYIMEAQADEIETELKDLSTLMEVIMGGLTRARRRGE